MSITACTPETITPGVVVFDPVAFVQSFPSFATVQPFMLNFNFGLAELQLDNSCCSVVKDAPTRQNLLWLLTAHITALLNGVNGQPPSGIVGRVSSATQGSVSVSAEFTSLGSSNIAASLKQTPWGAMFLALSAQYTSALYVGPRRGCGPWVNGGMAGYPSGIC